MLCAAAPNGSMVIQGIRPGPGYAPYVMNVMDGKDGVSREISRTKMWDRAKTTLLVSELPRLHSELKRRPVVLDIGANLGWFTLLAAASGHARVISVEASDQNCLMIERSLCMNGQSYSKHVTLHKMGVGAITADCALVSRRGNIGSPTAVCGRDDDPASFMNAWGNVLYWPQQQCAYYTPRCNLYP
tara:strand:+ start:2155 stop:2715 length:561 start_codon:yes stop_codon:yes gene_type:complete